MTASFLRPAALLALLLAGTGQAAQPITYRTFHYRCQGGAALDVAYVRFSGQPMFAVLRWQGAEYGLAQAVSASGARYAALAGGPNNAGLEWWEHQGEGTLSTFTGGTLNTRPLLTGCRVR